MPRAAVGSAGDNREITVGIGVSILLIVGGLVLALAVQAEYMFGLNLNMLGIILVVGGVLGLIVTMAIFAPRRTRQVPPPHQTYYRDDRGSY